VRSAIAATQTAAQILSKERLVLEQTLIENEHLRRNVLPGPTSESGLMLHLARLDPGNALREILYHRGAFCEALDDRRAHVSLHETCMLLN